MRSTHSTNLAGWVLRHAATAPERLALVIPREWSETEVIRDERVTFGELAERIARFRAGLHRGGFVRGDRVVVMFPVSVDLYAFVLALLASGMVAVFVDTGMGKKRVFQALRLSRAKGVVSVDPLMKLWPVLRVLWARKRYSVDRSRFGVELLSELADIPPSEEPVLEFEPDTPALMTFTSGSTGTPRAANRTHDILVAQHLALSEEFPEGEGEVDMPCFPVVPLHNLCCGITTVMPAVDLRAPATVNPALVVDQVAEFKVTRLTGAPAYLTRLADELEARGGGMETITVVGCGGAPTPVNLCRRLVKALPDAHLLVIYGSTEAEPMAHVTMQELLESEGNGYLVGRTADAATLEVVTLPPEVPQLDDRQMDPYRVQTGEVGEVVVRGAHVLRGYVDDPAADAQTKLPAPDGMVWHRTGDVGRWDEDGRLWLVGRMSDAIEIGGRVIHPFELESELDQWPEIRRSAAIASGAGVELLLELESGSQSRDVAPRVHKWLDENHVSLNIDVIDEIPMDPRHNSKVARVELRELRVKARGVPKTR